MNRPYDHLPAPVAPAKPRLLDDYIARAARRPSGALTATALRTASRPARALLAHLATDGTGDLGDLLAAARDRTRLHRLRIRPPALYDLAKVIGLQNREPDDRELALALYDLGLETYGPDPRSEHQALHVQLALKQGARARAQELLATYTAIPDDQRTYIRLDLMNPFSDPGQDTGAWLELFQSLMPQPEVILHDQPGLVPFDRLTTRAGTEVDSDARISVVVTCFRPGTGLLTAVRSLLDQSWTNIEIIIVDDGSPDEHHGVLNACADLDARVKVIKLPVNQGPYVARNAGLDAAAGPFVTFQGSDDWSHPARLQAQVTPLLNDDSLVATFTNGLRITGELLVSRLGRASLLLNTSSLMIRKDRVLRRIGYFDEVRRSADTEYRLRLEAVFGETAVLHMAPTPYAAIRDTGTSLSASDFAAGFLHPARVAYRSAYGLWHRRIASGTADPYRPRGATSRPFAAPLMLRVNQSCEAYDVIFASEWRVYGGPQKSMIEEINALTRAGRRVAVAQMEAYRFMTPKLRPMCDQIQEMINAGIVDHVVLSDEVATSVLIIRYPLVLQFADPVPSNIRAKHVVILANQAPCELDGSDVRYLPLDCTRAAREIFGVDPVWCPQGPRVRAALAPLLPFDQITSYNMPGIIDIERWGIQRTGFRSQIPVIGRHSRDDWGKWPGDADTLWAAYPASLDFDVRIMGGAKTPAKLVGEGRLPAHWLLYGYDEVDVRSFLFQLDFWVYYPHPRQVEAFGRAILEAIASGCVVILPDLFQPTFGDAAIYRDPSEVQATIRDYYSDKEKFLRQSRLAQQRVRESFSHESYLRLMSALIACDSRDDLLAGTRPEPTPVAFRKG